MKWRVGTPKIDGRKMLTITDGPKYADVAKKQAGQLKVLAIQVYKERFKNGPWRTSNTSPPKYVEVFTIRKIGRNWRLVNEDPGAVWVEWGAHPGGNPDVFILKYAPMRTALDRLEGRERAR